MKKEKRKPEDRILNLRRQWAENNFSLSPKGLAKLDRIMRSETGFDLDRLQGEFDFRFSAVIVKQGPPNNEDYILTVSSGGERELYGLPGGKMKVTNIPFSALRFARFWARNHKVYERSVFTGGEASLIRLLDGEQEKVISELESLARRMDRPLPDAYSEIRREGYRELKEEFDLEGLGLGGEDETSAEETSGAGTPGVYIHNAEPIGLYVERYRVALERGSDEAAKKWFISLNYLIEIPGSIEMLTSVLREGIQKTGEIGNLRWASLVEATMQGYPALYHYSVNYVARRLEAQGIVTKIRSGNGFSADRGSFPGEVVPEEFGWDKLR
ncbi:MAG: hypothetical protein AB1668_07140 [Nanoarchaeota archaeon]